jgi:hypothetical protein
VLTQDPDARCAGHVQPSTCGLCPAGKVSCVGEIAYINFVDTQCAGERLTDVDT